MLSGQAPEFAISTIAAFSTGFGYSFSLLYHAPIRIKSFRTFQSLEEKGCGAERPQISRSEATRCVPSFAPLTVLYRVPYFVNQPNRAHIDIEMEPYTTLTLETYLSSFSRLISGIDKTTKAFLH